MSDMQLDARQKEMLEKKLDSEENAFLRLQRKKMSVNDFEIVAIIGRGAFGEVLVCKCLFIFISFSRWYFLLAFFSCSTLIFHWNVKYTLVSDS